MKVLFVTSGNSESFKVSPFIKAQAGILASHGVNVDFFQIIGKGITGYMRGAFKLRKHLKKNAYDLIHAHYCLSGLTSVLALSRKPVVLSLMGDDALGTYIKQNKITFKSRFIITISLLIQPFVSAIIAKTEGINKRVYRKKISYVIPNGVDLEKYCDDGLAARQKLKFSDTKKYVLFFGNKLNVGKNYKLALEAVGRLNNENVEFVVPYPIPHELVSTYLNAADVLVHPSFMEGSPNLVKEAMACNLSVVATDVGDISWLFGDTEGYYLAPFNAQAFAEKIEQALVFVEIKGRTEGRKRLLELGLDADTVALKIIEVYKKVLG